MLVAAVEYIGDHVTCILSLSNPAQRHTGQVCVAGPTLYSLHMLHLCSTYCTRTCSIPGSRCHRDNTGFEELRWPVPVSKSAIPTTKPHSPALFGRPKRPGLAGTGGHFGEGRTCRPRSGRESELDGCACARESVAYASSELRGPIRVPPCRRTCPTISRSNTSPERPWHVGSA